MATKVRRRVFEDWAKGTYGTTSPLQGEYTGYNCQVYKSGAIGPRPGFVQWTFTGSPQFNEAADDFVGIMWYRDNVADPYVVISYTDDPAGTPGYDEEVLQVVPSTNTLNRVSTATGNRQWEVLDQGFVGKTDGTGYVENHARKIEMWAVHDIVASAGVLKSPYPLLVSVTGGPSDAAALTLYNNRIYAYGSDTSPGRIWFSDEGDFSTYTSGNTFDISPDASEYGLAVIGVWATASGLLMARRDGVWFVLSGVSPETGSLRELEKDRVPDALGGAQVDDAVFFLNKTGYGVTVARPSTIDSRTFEHLSLLHIPRMEYIWRNNFQVKGSVSDEYNRNVILSGTRYYNIDTEWMAVELVNGVWNYSLWVYEDSSSDVWMCPGEENTFWMMVIDGTDLHVMSRHYTLDRPARSSKDQYSVALTVEQERNTTQEAAFGVDNGMLVRLGDTYDKEGDLVRPTKLVLDIEYWKEDTDYEDVSILATPVIRGTPDATTPEVTGTTVTVSTTGWPDTDASNDSDPTGLRHRVEVPFEFLPFGTSFYIDIEGESFAIHRAIVEYEIDVTRE